MNLKKIKKTNVEKLKIKYNIEIKGLMANKPNEKKDLKKKLIK